MKIVGIVVCGLVVAYVGGISYLARKYGEPRAEEV